MNVAYLQIVIVYGLQRVQNFWLSCTATEKNKTFYCIVSEKKTVTPLHTGVLQSPL